MTSQTQWQKLISREGVDILSTSGIDAAFYDVIEDATGTKGELFFTVFEDRNFTHYIAADPLLVGRFAYKRDFSDKKQIVSYYERGTQFMREASEVAANSVSGPLQSGLRACRKQFEYVNRWYSITPFIALEAWQTDFERHMNAMIERNTLEKERELVLLTVCKPWKETALREIQKKLAEGEDEVSLAEKYQYLRSWSLVWNRPLSPEWINGLRMEKDAKEPATYSFEEITKLLKPNAEELAFLDIAPYMIFFKDWRDDLRRFHAYQWSSFFDAVAASLGVLRDDVGYLTFDELEEALKAGSMDSARIGKRKEYAVVTKENGRIVVSNDKKYEAYIRSAREAGSDIVRGVIAQKGIARGAVCIVRSHHDLKRIREGDILVANTTHPEYIPAMRKAAAFVTNEGGITSHAAIIAREMKKPCITGTKQATLMLKDGDMVEVDAEKGIVRKMN